MLLSIMMAVLGRRRSLLPSRTGHTAILSMARNQMGNAQVLRECLAFLRSGAREIQRHNDLTYRATIYFLFLVSKWTKARSQLPSMRTVPLPFTLEPSFRVYACHPFQLTDTASHLCLARRHCHSFAYKPWTLALASSPFLNVATSTRSSNAFHLWFFFLAFFSIWFWSWLA